MKIFYNVVCLGAGGTGTFFIKEFARFLASFRLKDVDKIVSLAIVDGDRVEEKNLERQAYIAGDINSNKAVCISEAIQSCFNLKRVIAFPRYIDTVGELRHVFRSLERINPGVRAQEKVLKIEILIGTVDNHRARQVMHQYFEERKDILLLYYDAANEYSGGEVVFSGQNNGQLLGRPRAAYYPVVLEDTSPRASELSCGTVNEDSPQHICTNMMAANLLLSRVTKLIADNEMEFGIAIFDAFRLHVAFYPDMETNQERNEDEKKKPKRKRGKKTSQEVKEAS